MSIPLVQNNEKDSINTSIIAIKRNIERINMLLGLSNSEEIDTSKFATKDELQQAVTDLQPVDTVTSGNMQSVTSNAVANELLQKASVINEIYGESHSFIMNTLIGLKNFALIILQAGTAELSYSVGIYTEFGGYRINWLYNYIPNAFSFNPNTTELTISAFVRILILY